MSSRPALPLALALAAAVAATALAGAEAPPARPAGATRWLPAAPRDAALERGGLALFRMGRPADGAVRRDAAPAFVEWRRLGGLDPRERPEPWPLPAALGDRLVLSLDDGLGAPVDLEWEARLDVSGGAAGPTDHVAVRFPSQALAASPPFRVTDVLLGLDDRHGATGWPAVGVLVEQAVSPLAPVGVLDATNAVLGFDAAALLPPVPATQARPGAFARLPVGLPAVDVAPAWLADGSFDDGFDRTDAPLDNPASDWLECQGTACGGFSSLRVSADRAVRQPSGASVLGVKFQAPDVFAVRAARDLDLVVGVDLDLADAAASRAGLLLRAVAPDAAYRVEVDKAAGLVEVAALTPGGVVVLDSWPLPAPTDTPRLEVEVTGGSPAVEVVARVDGLELGRVTDPVYRFTGTLAGLSASDPTSSGEAWDGFTVARRPDVFAVVRFPPGVDAGLALDVSDDSVISEAVLLSADGVDWSPRPPGPGCVNPGNPLVQVEVEEVTTSGLLFENEAHVVGVELLCPSCRLGENACSENASIAQRRQPVPTVGEPLTVRVGWWNEHHSDDDRLLLAVTLWDAPCSSATARPLASASVVLGQDAGQLSTGPELRWADTLAFAPTAAGPHCVTVEEHHDLNADCCPDGRELSPFPGAGCPGTCTPAPASDSNASTWLVLRDVLVEEPCTAPPPPNLDGASLRVARLPGDAVATELTWAVLDPGTFPGSFHLHAMEAGRFDPDRCFHEVAPVVASPAGVTRRVLDLPAPASGRPLWLALFETDGCPQGASVPDDSLTVDPAVRCSP